MSKEKSRCTRATGIENIRSCDADTQISTSENGKSVVKSHFHKLSFKISKILWPNHQLLIVRRPNFAKADDWIDPVLQLQPGEMAVQTTEVKKMDAGTYAKSAKKISRMVRHYETNQKEDKLIQPSPKHIREQKFPASKFSLLGPGFTEGANVRIGVPREINAPEFKKPLVKSVEKPHPSLIKKLISKEQEELDLRIKITQKQIERLQQFQENENQEVKNLKNSIFSLDTEIEICNSLLNFQSSKISSKFRKLEIPRENPQTIVREPVDPNNNKQQSTKRRLVPANYDPLEFATQLGKRQRTAPRITTSRPADSPHSRFSPPSATITSSEAQVPDNDVFNVDIEAIRLKFEENQKRVDNLVERLMKEPNTRAAPVPDEEDFEALLQSLHKVAEPSAPMDDDADILDLGCGDFDTSLL